MASPAQPPSRTRVRAPNFHPTMQAAQTETVSVNSGTGFESASIEIVPENQTAAMLMNLRIGTRVKWHVTATTSAKPATPGMMAILPPKGTLFGRVAPRTQTMADGWLYVHEEGSGRIWALNPTTDHITVLSAP